MKTLYFDCAAGISGDMTVAALLDLGASETDVCAALDGLHLSGYTINIQRVVRNGISACHFKVQLENECKNIHSDWPMKAILKIKKKDEIDSGGKACDTLNNGKQEPDDAELARHHHHTHRTHRDIQNLLNAAELPDEVRELSLRVFARIAEAEGKIHRRHPDEVGFHEVGAVDSIVDIVAAAAAVCSLKPDRVAFSIIQDGSGTIRCQHGLIPVPAPATLAILSACGAVLQTTDIRGEMVTPTGAGMAAALGESFGRPAPAGRVLAVGYGAGAKVFPNVNVLRVLLIQEVDPVTGEEKD